MSSYPYGPEWRATVNKMSDEWRAYCEAVEQLRRYVRDTSLVGKRKAWEAMQTRLSGLGNRCERVRTDVVLIGKNEIEMIREIEGRADGK